MTTKPELIAAVANAMGQPQSIARPYVESVFNLISADLIGGKEVRIAGFGNFAVKPVKERQARNPRTGEAITVAAHGKLTFKPAADLKGRI